MTFVTVNRLRLVFSYTHPLGGSFQDEVLSINLRCLVARTRDQCDEIMSREHEQAGQDVVSFLCKPSEEAVSAKIDWYVEDLAYHHRNIDGILAVIKVDRVL
ncbi:hypothetical protein [Rhodoferax antarcticus]|uniref:hypothetical protein n=1 Tax=Rhodoferax antarcticus TaxID=81479 RepID=UPI000A98A7D6|nr:hypothetical protein [Rhodoferax antarcticus]